MARAPILASLLACLTLLNNVSPSAAVPAAADIPTKPNIIFILTDDQDTQMNSLDYMPLLKKYMRDEGTTFSHHYCTVALCCPARAALWTGRNAHNTNVTDLAPPWGGYPKFVNRGWNNDWAPLWLQDVGYQTYYVGKLLNHYKIDIYDKPCPKGWTGSEILIDPFTYSYWNTVSTRNCGPPIFHNGTYNTDLVKKASFDFLDDAVEDGSPFFLAINPVAPHTQIEPGAGTLPVPEEKYSKMFLDKKVPRSANFNPDVPSGGGWVRGLKKLTTAQLERGDESFRKRLQTLQSVDAMVEELFQKLKGYNLLDNTYIFYSSDNGFHISHHRLKPGKMCGYEEDVNVPLIVRGPGVAKGVVESAVTAHVDLVPTFMKLAGGAQRPGFDGSPIPMIDLPDWPTREREHANIEFWSDWVTPAEDLGPTDNTYKALRLVGEGYNLYYSVWCHGEHELYEMTEDPGQMNNLFADGFEGTGPDSTVTSTTLGVTDYQLASRLDALMFILKTCTAKSCRKPWEMLMSDASIKTLRQALRTEHDAFFSSEIPRVSFSRCAAGYIVSAEGPQYDAWRSDRDLEMGLEEKRGVFDGEDPEWAQWV